VVEEPGEEPKLYRQDTGELVTNSSFIDPLTNGENNENPVELPRSKEKPKHASGQHSKLYKDIDDLIESLRSEEGSLKAPLDLKSSNKSAEKNSPGRRNSIHLSSVRRDRDDRKEKRYSYNGNNSARNPPPTISEIVETKPTGVAAAPRIDSYSQDEHKKVAFYYPSDLQSV